MLSVDPQQLEVPRVGQNTPTLGLWPALRSTALFLASLGLALIGTLSLLGPSDSLSDRALRRACYALDDHFVVPSCSAPNPVAGGIDLDVTAAFLLAGVMTALFLWSMQGYWRPYARGVGGLASRLFRG
jgi:hypothetical protein